MKISFILPIYNVEAYLRECVDSLTCQTFKDFEIILVDDGSPDGCPALCDQLATEDNRIKVLHKPNGGLSDARNAGLKVASGDYVIFVDSDDKWIGENSLEKLIELIKTYPECQFYGFNCQYFYPATNTYSKWVAYAENILTPINGSSAMCALVESGTLPMSSCMKVINRQWITNLQITFKVGQLSEDIPWFINLLDKCEVCVFVNDYIYAYRQNREGSITASGGERSFNNLLDIVKTELELLDSRTFSIDAKNALLSFLGYEVSILMAETCRLPQEKQSTAREELKQLCWLLRYTQNPKVRLVNRVYSLFGYAITERVLKVYNWYRTRKK